MRVAKTLPPPHPSEVAPDTPSTRNEEAHELAIATRDRHIEKEQLQDYIQKKREMFLVQYQLQIKRDEIELLEKKTQKEEQALEQKEHKLEVQTSLFLTTHSQDRCVGGHEEVRPVLARQRQEFCRCNRGSRCTDST